MIKINSQKNDKNKHKKMIKIKPQKKPSCFPFFIIIVYLLFVILLELIINL